MSRMSRMFGMFGMFRMFQGGMFRSGLFGILLEIPRGLVHT